MPYFCGGGEEQAKKRVNYSLCGRKKEKFSKKILVKFTI